MVADPFQVTLVFNRGPGQPAAADFTLSVSDVAGEFALNVEDGLAFIRLPSNMGALYLSNESFATEDGADTTQFQVFVNGQPTGLRLKYASMASAANVARVPTRGFRPGTQIALKQLA